MTFPRYIFDDPSQYSLELHDLPEEIRARAAALGNGVRVSDGLLGDVANAVKCAADRLNADAHIECFVTATPELSAECYRDANGSVVVMMSSRLVNLLTADELLFVIGHELTHVQLNHHGWIAPGRADASDRGLEGLRAMEISADRGGAIACGDVETSIRAIAKTASGIATIVDDMNVLDYVRQERSARVSASYAAIVARSTHPPLVTRARALLRLAGAVGESLTLDALNDADLEPLDLDIARDLDALFVNSDGFDERCASAAFWIAIDDRMPMNDPAAWCRQRLQHLGDQRLRSFASLSQDLSPEELHAHIRAKAGQWRAEISSSVRAMQCRVDDMTTSVTQGGPTR